MSSISKTKLDQKLNSYTPLDPTDKTKDFLCDFFKILPPGGKQNLVGDVSECTNDEKLRQLVQSIRTGLLIPIKAQGGKTPTEITPSPPSGAEDSIENLKSLNIEPISRSSQLRPRHHCLERDGNKCLATGQYSCSHAHPRSAITTHLEAAHIIPFALGSFQANDGEAVDRHAKIWVNLRRYFPVLRSMAFSSEKINSEMNVLMLDSPLHKESSLKQLELLTNIESRPFQIRPQGRYEIYLEIGSSSSESTKEVGNFHIINFSKSTLVLGTFYI